MAINIKFPLEDDIEKNILFKQNNLSKDALVSNLMLLLLTEEGERYYMPDYGMNLKKYIFEPKDGITEKDITEEIRERVKRFIPELTITSVKFYSSEVDVDGLDLQDNEVSVLVNFTYDNDTFSENGSVEITFPA
jgi:phage baseplate assembly protein W